ECLAAQQVENQSMLHVLIVADNNVVEYGKRQGQARALKCAGDTRSIDLLRRLADDFLAVVEDAALAGAVQPCQYNKEGRLAGSIGAEQAQDFTFMNVHVQAIK